jgi:hypothetical protein
MTQSNGEKTKGSKRDDRTRRWGNGRHHATRPKVIENRFATVASDWFYGLTGRFITCKEKTSLWGGEVGATFLSSLFLTLSRIVDCTGPYTPGVDILAHDLLELVWPLRIADVAQVRASVLYAVGTSFSYLPDERVLALMMDSTPGNLITNIQFIQKNDPDSDCRTLAYQLHTSVAITLKAMDNPRLLR